MVYNAIEKEIQKRKHTGEEWEHLQHLLDEEILTMTKRYLPKHIQEKIDLFWHFNSEIKLKIKTNYNLLELLDLIVPKAKVWIVGGFIRDVIAGFDPKDVDLVVDNVQKVKEQLKRHNIEFQEVGAHFGVILVNINGENFEIANLRSDKDNSGFKPGTLKQDWERRDFDVNCIYFSIQKMEIEDKLDKSGIENASKRMFQFQGNPHQRIIEDPMRVLRVYKLTQKGFTPSNKTLAEARKHFEYMIQNVNPNRLRSEFENLILK